MMDSLSGNLRVEGGSRTRRGVRRPGGRASCNSPEKLAGSDAKSGMTAGGDATSSPAPTADHKTDADPAKTKAKEARRTPKKKEKKSKPKKNEAKKSKARRGGDGEEPVESLWNERAELDGGEELPGDGVAFVDAVNVHIDLVRLTELLLRGRDERSSKSLLEQLLDMRYGKNALSAAGSSGPVIDCVPRAIRD